MERLFFPPKPPFSCAPDSECPEAVSCSDDPGRDQDATAPEAVSCAQTRNFLARSTSNPAEYRWRNINAVLARSHPRWGFGFAEPRFHVANDPPAGNRRQRPHRSHVGIL